MTDGQGETPTTEQPDTDSPEHRGKIILTFNMEDQLQVEYTDMKPWKLWAAGKMIEMLGDQMFVNVQLQRMQQEQAEARARQELLEGLQRAPGGLRGPVRRGDS